MGNDMLLTSKQRDEPIKLKIEILDIIFEKHLVDMENKINIAELLKDCPRGIELDCTMFDNVTFIGVGDIEKQFPIEIKISGNKSKYLTKTGCFHDDTLIPEAKCVIFPKGKTTWEGFRRPFNDGDILAIGDTVYIYNGEEELSPFPTHYAYVIADKNGLFEINTSTKRYGTRFATEEEKNILFKAIKNNGYEWRQDTKSLVKFFKPFDKVLVRDDNECVWKADFYSHYKGDIDFCYVCTGDAYKQCIPYNEENAHLIGTNHDCSDKYKTWKNE